MSSNYWDSGAPSALGSEFNLGSPSPTPIPAAGPRT
jgi:hypothetical protein